MQGLLRPRLGTDTFTFASLCWSRQVTMLSPMSRSKEICSTSMGGSGCGVPPDPCSEPRHSFPQLLGILLASIQNISEGPSQLQSFAWDWLRPWLQLSQSHFFLSAQSCFPHSVKVLFPRALVNNTTYKSNLQHGRNSKDNATGMDPVQERIRTNNVIYLCICQLD